MFMKFGQYADCEPEKKTVGQIWDFLS